MAMTTNLIHMGNNVLRTEWTTGLCSPLVFTTVKLFKNGTEIATFNTSGFAHDWPGQYTAGDYYSTVTGFNGDPPTQCDTGTSSTITLSSFCLPVSPTNVSFSKLRLFYGIVSADDIALSGPNNPSSGTSIFGSSALPNTGTISKTIPNAVSELFNTCGGVQTWESWPFVLAFGSTQTLSCDAGIGATTTYYVNNQTLTSATSLWSNSSLTTLVTTAGWYSNGTKWIRIDVTGSVISSGDCVF